MKLTGKQSFLGIAIGERSVTVAEVGPPRRGGTGYNVRHTAHFAPAGADGLTPEAFAAFLRQHSFGAKHAVVGVPARWVIARERDIPPSSEDQAAEVLRMQAERMFTAELGEVAVDYAGTADASAPRGVLLVALPRTQLDRVVRLVESAGVEVAAVMPTTLALAGADESTDGLVLSLSDDAVELAAHRGGAPRLLRHLPIRGADVASANGSQATAMAALAGEIRRTVALMPRSPGATPTSANQLQLWDGIGLGADGSSTLARQSGVVLRERDRAATNNAASQYAPAIALALAGAAPHPGTVDFRHPRLAAPKRQRIGRRTAWAIGIAAAALLLLVGLWAEVRWRESQLAAVQAEINAMKPKVESAEHVSQLIGVARGWFPEGRPAALDCLRDITNAFPDGGESIFVTKFTLPETRQGNFTGRAPNRDLVLDLVVRMNKSKTKSFANVKPDYMLDAGGSSNEVAFSISFTYQGTGDNAAPTPTTNRTQTASNAK